MLIRSCLLLILSLAAFACLQPAGSLPGAGEVTDVSNSGGSQDAGTAQNTPNDGEEGGPCYGNNTCNAGLTCLSGICVNANGVDGSGDGSTDGSTDGPSDGTSSGSTDGTADGSTDGDGNGGGTGNTLLTTDGGVFDGAIDGSGEYETGLPVADGGVPIDAALSLQLNWNVNVDDLDLYFYRADGDICKREDSCYWMSCLDEDVDVGPDWDEDGVYGTAGDPRMLTDDLCGYGPEHIYLEQPADDGAYIIAVHFFGSAACENNAPAQSTMATVNVLVYDEVAQTFTRTLYTKDDRWDVAKILWNNGEPSIIPINEYESDWRCDFAANGFGNNGGN